MTVEGRPATVAYISNDFEPVSPDDADMVKVVFDDGEVRFGVKAKDERKSEAREGAGGHRQRDQEAPRAGHGHDRDSARN